MIRRSTWILLVVFIVLVAGTYYWQRNKSEKEAQQAQITPTVQVMQSLFDLTDKIVDQIAFVGPEGSTLILQLDTATQAWSVMDVPAEEADQTLIQTGAEQLFALNVATTFSAPPPLEQLGLDLPAYRIMLHTEDGSNIVLRVGDMTPTGSGYYVQVDSQPPVVVTKSGLDTVLNLLKNPPLLPTPTPEATSPSFEPSATPGN
jgi:hypothetical protein